MLGCCCGGFGFLHGFDRYGDRERGSLVFLYFKRKIGGRKKNGCQGTFPYLAARQLEELFLLEVVRHSRLICRNRVQSTVHNGGVCESCGTMCAFIDCY